nr:MAG TPA: hypothetical protein [Caudoviricetes sp.]
MSATNLILSSLWLTPPPKLRGSVHLALTSSMSPSSRRALVATQNQPCLSIV